MSYYKNSLSPKPSNNRQTLTSCYFCNEAMDLKYLPEHLIHCGAILDECPEKCGAYVQRSELQAHLCQCLRGLTGKVNRIGASSIDETIRSLQESTWKNKVVSILSLLRTAVHEGEEEIKELRDTLASSLQLTNEALRKDILEELYENRKTIGLISSRLNNLEKSYGDLQHKSTNNFQRTDAQIDELKFKITNEQHLWTEEREKFYTQLEVMKVKFTAESTKIFKLWQEQMQNMYDMKLELEMRCKLSKELVTKYNELFDKIESLEDRMQKYSEAIDRQTTNWKTLKFQMKENVKYVEDVLKDMRNNYTEKVFKHYDCNCNNESTAIGRLIWRIERFDEKMVEAKQNNCILVSPTFYDKEYGYTLKMELHLNGLGRWKNRHVIVCLRIVNGKWDSLLDWPCALGADVVLKDQDDAENDLKKFVRTAKMKKNDEDLEHNLDLHMFIPHTTLDRYHGYTRDNVMFLEIRVKDSKFKGSTMSLV